MYAAVTGLAAVALTYFNGKFNIATSIAYGFMGPVALKDRLISHVEDQMPKTADGTIGDITSDAEFGPRKSISVKLKKVLESKKELKKTKPTEDGRDENDGRPM